MRKRTLALIAHDAKKDDMVAFIQAHKKEIVELQLIATRNTGRIAQDRIQLPITMLQSGSLGGDQQIGALVASGDIDAIIFLRDPLKAHPHEPDVTALLRVCDVHNIPLATNLATAEAVLHLLTNEPSVLRGAHLTAEFLEKIAAVH